MNIVPFTHAYVFLKGLANGSTVNKMSVTEIASQVNIQYSMSQHNISGAVSQVGTSLYNSDALGRFGSCVYFSRLFSRLVDATEALAVRVRTRNINVQRRNLADI